MGRALRQQTIDQPVLDQTLLCLWPVEGSGRENQWQGMEHH